MKQISQIFIYQFQVIDIFLKIFSLLPQPFTGQDMPHPSLIYHGSSYKIGPRQQLHRAPVHLQQQEEPGQAVQQDGRLRQDGD